MSHNKS